MGCIFLHQQIVEFHLGWGEFVHYGPTIDFVAGDEAWSYTEREKVYHCGLSAGTRFFC